MRVDKMGSKSDVFVKLVLVFFISLLSFAIGTFVGKKYSDNQHKLSQLEPSGKSKSHEVENAEAHEEAATTDEHAASEHGKPEKEGAALTDSEIAKLAEEFVKDEEAPVATGTATAHGAEHGAEHGTVSKSEHAPARATASVEKSETTSAHGANHETTEAAHAPAAQTPAGHGSATQTKTPVAGHATAPAVIKPAPAHGAPAAAAGHAAHNTTEQINEIADQVAKEKILNERAPAKVSGPKELPRELAGSTVGKFTVQVASQAAEADALKLSEELKKKGYAAFYVPANIKGQTYYRVSVGMFSSQKEASSYRSELIEKANVGSAFVQKISP